jgi:hypothetical protein
MILPRHKFTTKILSHDDAVGWTKVVGGRVLGLCSVVDRWWVDYYVGGEGWMGGAEVGVGVRKMLD